MGRDGGDGGDDDDDDEEEGEEEEGGQWNERGILKLDDLVGWCILGKSRWLSHCLGRRRRRNLEREGGERERDG